MINTNFLTEFISVEREYYLAEDNNRFAASLSQSLRYYEFILIVSERHQEVSQKIHLNTQQLQAMFSGGGVVTDNQISHLEAQRRLSAMVHLEIESFYLFAKILLDKLAFFIQDFFGKARGCSLISHDRLTRQHKRFFLAKELVFPKGFSENLISLKEQISDFRDKQISHFSNPRAIRPTTIDSSGQTKITITHLYPNERELEKEQVTSKNLPDLLETIELYIHQIIEIVVSNRKKTRFQLSG